MGRKRKEIEDRPDTCPRCGGTKIWSSGVRKKDAERKEPKQRWKCGDCAFRWVVGPHNSPPKEHSFRDELRADTHRYIITWAQNATEVHEGFWETLLRYTQHKDADLVVIPGRYKNPTSFWTANNESEEWWAGCTQDYIYDKRTDLCPMLTLLADIRVQPTAVRPLVGLDSITGGKSGIIGHPKLELTVVPTPQNKYPKDMMTTGACTMPNYTDSKAGAKGTFHHTYGAVIVEIQGDWAHIRHINATDDGGFIDLDTQYFPDKDPEPAPPALALIMGDWHHGFTDPSKISATIDGPGSMVEVVRPKKLIWHDLLDQYGRNHHHKDDPFTAKAKHDDLIYERNDLDTEVRGACQEVLDLTATASAIAGHEVESIVVASNHDEALTRYIKERNWKNDPENMLFYLETAKRMVEQTTMEYYGASYPEAFHVWAAELMPNVRMLKRNESYMVADIECGMHGDVGPNGSRGSVYGFARLGVKTVSGHTHTKWIMEGAYKTATSTYLDLEYARRGASSWSQCDCVIYANGKRALFTVYDGSWRY